MRKIEEIIEGCRSQEKRSQEELYKQFYPALFSLCKTFFSDKDDVVTALNNGMLNVFTKIHLYDVNKGNFFNWVYTIVRNSAITLVKSKDNEKKYVLNDHQFDVDMRNPFAFAEVKDIYIYIDKLPPKTRCVCVLFYLEGLSIKEIAAQMSISEGVVRWHLVECRKRLKNIFNQIKI